MFSKIEFCIILPQPKMGNLPALTTFPLLTQPNSTSSWECLCNGSDHPHHPTTLSQIRRCAVANPCLVWGAPAKSPPKRIHFPFTIVKIKHGNSRKYFLPDLNLLWKSPRFLVKTTKILSVWRCLFKWKDLILPLNVQS